MQRYDKFTEYQQSGKTFFSFSNVIRMQEMLINIRPFTVA